MRHQGIYQPDSFVLKGGVVYQLGDGAEDEDGEDGFVAYGRRVSDPFGMGPVLPYLRIGRCIPSSFERPGRESFEGVDGIQPFHSVQRFAAVLQRLRRPGGGIAEHFCAQVHGGPETVVIGVFKRAGAKVSVFHPAQGRVKSQTDMRFADLPLIKDRFVSQGHLPETDLTQPFVRKDQYGSLRASGQIGDLIGRQPAAGGIIIEFPVLTQDKSALCGAEPGPAVDTSDNGQIGTGKLAVSVSQNGARCGVEDKIAIMGADQDRFVILYRFEAGEVIALVDDAQLFVGESKDGNRFFSQDPEGVFPAVEADIDNAIGCDSIPYYLRVFQVLQGMAVGEQEGESGSSHKQLY